MQTLHYQNGNTLPPFAMIYQNRSENDKAAQEVSCVRVAVRAWAANCRNREYVAALIAEEWRSSGSEGLSIPTDSHRQMQKIFRWIDGDTDYAAENVRLLTPAIMAVLPLEFRSKLVSADDMVSRVSVAMKECMEAKQAIMLGAPEHQKLKEVSEGIASLFRLMPDQVGPLMTMVTSMLGVM